MPLTSALGYPRIGEDRELKFALEGYWSGKRSKEELDAVASSIRRRNWQTQREAGIDLIPSNDFSLYDHVLDMSCLTGAVPERFEWNGKDVSLDTYFALARRTVPDEICCATHDAVAGVAAQTLHKWFDTNYHYLVPEFTKDQSFRLSSQKPFAEYAEALDAGIDTKPVLLGPVSFLLLGRCAGQEFDRLQLLDRLLSVYEEIIGRLSDLGAKWIQFDEPALVLDLRDEQRNAFRRAYDVLRNAAPEPRLMLGTYFGDLRENLDIALSLPVDAVHVDTVEAQAETVRAIHRFPADKTLSVGIVDGRNIWKNDLLQSLKLLQCAKKNLGNDRLIISSSSSLLHVPYSVSREENLDPLIRDRLAFAREKLSEISLLRDALRGKAGAIDACIAQSNALASDHSAFGNDDVRQKVEEWKRDGVGWRIDSEKRRAAQKKTLALPAFPTTTIGSFPQTANIRSARARHRRGEIDDDAYDRFVRDEIASVIRRQQETGLDVLVHGEPERNDMVQYFAEHLDGIAGTRHGWVQSFGSRYVRPPIIHADVSRPSAFTVPLATYAQSLTEKPVKGMLTGPNTILHWSFVRTDIPTDDVCRQIALAIRDEVRDLEEAGIKIIQIDEPGLREGLPLREDGRADYLRRSTDAFRAVVCDVKPSTQIHTHTCYGDVRDILPVLRDMDVDVISVEAARTRLAFLHAIDSGDLPCEIGPGIWDIHSPRIPSVDELVEMIESARRHVPGDRLWINPDCGLKTRSSDEVWKSLTHLVEAARITRSHAAPHD